MRVRIMSVALILLLFVPYSLLVQQVKLPREHYYRRLGVSVYATRQQIRTAYHKLALKYHPDRNRSPEAEREFREIAEAYELAAHEQRQRRLQLEEESFVEFIFQNFY